jgi:hypothetical protein
MGGKLSPKPKIPKIRAMPIRQKATGKPAKMLTSMIGNIKSAI